MSEIWKDIPDYEGLYSISNLGRVYSHRSGIILKTTISQTGYRYVYFSVDGHFKGFRVCRLVGAAFVENDNPAEKTQINHKDQNKLNDCADNLEWMTPSENCNYGDRNERMVKTRREKHPKQEKAKTIKPPRYPKIMCVETGIIYKGTREAQRETGVSHGSICRNLKGRYAHAGGYHWTVV